jgi:hypothetical protein
VYLKNLERARKQKEHISFFFDKKYPFEETIPLRLEEKRKKMSRLVPSRFGLFVHSGSLTLGKERKRRGG